MLSAGAVLGDVTLPIPSSSNKLGLPFQMLEGQREIKDGLAVASGSHAAQTAAHVHPSRRRDEQPFFRSDIRTDFDL